MGIAGVRAPRPWRLAEASRTYGLQEGKSRTFSRRPMRAESLSIRRFYSRALLILPEAGHTSCNMTDCITRQ